MGNLFGKKKVSRITAQDRSILQLKNQRDKLKQYQRKLENTLEKERQVARQLLHEGKKDRARLILRKKAHLEKVIGNTDGQLFNLEQMVHDIEFAQVEVKVVEGLKAGNNALKQLHNILNIDDIEKLMEETREGVEKQREIDEILSGAIFNDDDEQAIEEELAALVESETQPLKLPDVPTHKIETKKKAGEAEQKIKQPLLAT